jgi:uncharacterized protein (TIGR03083 family)
VPGLLTCPQYLVHLRDSAAGFADGVATGDLDAPVAACPGWTLRDLAWHMGGVHRWATVALRENRAGDATHDGPVDAGPLAGWLREGAAGLVEALAAADPQAPCWSFGPPPRLAGFWFRRQALETAIHLWDAQAALGSPPAVDAGLADDGVDEVVTMMFPRQVRLSRCAPLSSSLAVRATDAGGARRVLAADGLPGEATAGDAPASATISGPADRLFLLLWKRIGPDDPALTVEGDAGAAQAVLVQPIVP